MSALQMHPLAIRQLITTGGGLASAMGELANRATPLAVTVVETDGAIGTGMHVYGIARGFFWAATRITPLYDGGLGADNERSIREAAKGCLDKPSLLVLSDCGREGRDLVDALRIAAEHAHPMGLCGVIAITHDSADEMAAAVRAVADVDIEPVTFTRRLVRPSDEELLAVTHG